MKNNKFHELNEVKEWLEAQSYTAGFDENKCFSLFKRWFKQDGIRHKILEQLGFNDDDTSKQTKEKISLVNTVINKLENILHDELWEHAHELETRREHIQQFVVGLGIGHYLNVGLISKNSRKLE